MSDSCSLCGKKVYPVEKITADNLVLHKTCLRCTQCNVVLSVGNYASAQGRFYCKPHFKQAFMTKGNYNEGFGSEKVTKNWAPQASTVFKGAIAGIAAAAPGGAALVESADGKASELSPAPSFALPSRPDPGMKAKKQTSRASSKAAPAAATSQNAAPESSAAPSAPVASTLKREFSDHMSAEAQTSSIPFIIRLMYVVLMGYSYLVSLVTGDHVLVQFAFYFVIIVMFYLWHWLAHQKETGRMHEIHWRHHFYSFPPKKFYGDPGTCTREYGSECPTLLELMDPRRSTNFTIYHEGLLYGLLFLALAAERYLFRYSWATVFFSLLMSAFIGSIGSALHSSFHVRGFQLEKYQWYQELRALHYIHHLGSTQHNFGVFNIGLVDGLLNSIRLTDPVAKTELDVSLPDNISPQHVLAAQSTAGNAGRLVLLTAVHHQDESEAMRQLQRMSAVKRGYPTVLLRFVLVGFGFWFWELGQQVLRTYASPVRVVSDIAVGDFGHALLAPVRDWVIATHPHVVAMVHNAQMMGSDAAVVLLASLALFGPSVYGSLTVVIALLFRSLAQFLTPFVSVPHGILLPPLSFSTLLGSVPAAEASFVCPHLIVAVALFLETISRSAIFGRIGPVIASLYLIFQLAAGLFLRVAWSMDLLIAIAVTLVAGRVARRVAPHLDGVHCL